jgi:hypothetical protein
MNQNHNHEHGHDTSLTAELLHHFPYAVFSVAFALSILSFVGVISYGDMDIKSIKKSAHILFHSFHFMHIVFAAMGTIITYLRFSKNIIKALLVGLISPTIFCMLSDAVLPYIAGRILGVNMHFHICFYSELSNVLPFLFVGIITGFVLSKNHDSKQGDYSLSSHAIHIFVSALASTFYLVGHGFTNWYEHIGMVFLSLIIAVVVPCTLSDVVVPMMFARVDAKNEKHKNR